jgi:ABC-2 type transport system permease protein
MRLLRVELHRFRARRAVALMLLAVTLLVAWMTLDTVWSTRAVSDSEIAAAKEQAASELEFYQDEYDRCVDDPLGYFGVDDIPASECPRPEVDYRWYLNRAPLSVDEELNDTGKAAVIFLAGIAIIVGATFAGADWGTGSMGNQLLFRPRRLQVWAAKAAAVALGATAVAAVVIAAQWGTYFLTAEVRDVGHSPGLVRDVVEFGLRGLALVAGGAIGGFALTMLLRSTVGTLALVFFYSVGGEALVAVLPVDRVTRWSPGNNVIAWLDNGVEIYDESIVCSPREMDCMQMFTLSLTHGAVYLAALLAVVIVASAGLFRHRDVP